MHNKKFSNDIVEKQLRGLIVEMVNCREDRIKLGTKLIDDLGVDSFAVLEVLVSIESKFGLSIPENELQQIVTFRDLVNLITGLLTTAVSGR